MANETAPTDLFLGIDLGTSGCRAIVIDANRDIVAQARAPLPASLHERNGFSEQLPADWWEAVVGVVQRIDRCHRERIAAIAVDGTSSSILLCDPTGTPLTRALMYDDRRATAAAQRVAAVAPTESPAHGAGSALAKLIYLYDELAPSGQVHALHQADWITAKLRADFTLSDENNCLKLGYDPVSRSWPAWMAELGVPSSVLPTVKPIGSVVGTVSAEMADTLGLSLKARIVTGTTDSNAASLAAGITRTGEAVTSLGSTLVLKILSDQPVSAPQFGVYSHRIGDRWLVGGASNTGGAVLRRYFSDSEIVRLSALIDTERASDLDYYPLPGPGERFPICDPELAPRLTPRPNDPVAFLHGQLEGMARIEAQGYRRLVSLGAPAPSHVLSSGGGAVNDAWRRIRQRHLGVTVERATHTEAAYGVAQLAHSALFRRNHR